MHVVVHGGHAMIGTIGTCKRHTQGQVIAMMTGVTRYTKLGCHKISRFDVEILAIDFHHHAHHVAGFLFFWFGIRCKVHMHGVGIAGHMLMAIVTMITQGYAEGVHYLPELLRGGVLGQNFQILEFHLMGWRIRSGRNTQ